MRASRLTLPRSLRAAVILAVACAGCASPVGQAPSAEDDVLRGDGFADGAALPEDAGVLERDGAAADAGPADAARPRPEAPSAAPCDFRAEMAHCGACHAFGGAAGLDLVSPGLESRLIGVEARSECGSGQLVDTANPAQSVLYVRLVDDACGPSSLHRRKPSEQACVLGWIESL